MAAVLPSAPTVNQTASITASPITAPAIMATCGVLRVPWVTERKVGKYPARESE